MRRRATFVSILAALVTSCALCQEVENPTSDAGNDAAVMSDATTPDGDGPTDAGGDACVAETDDEFCDRLLKTCDVVTAEDNCGVERSVNCGACADGETCGQVEANVCGCPCTIDGDCVLSGTVNPDNPCLRCDPTMDRMDWSAAVGVECDDADACTMLSTCTAEGTCVADVADPGCSGLDTDCMVGVCDQTAGGCVTTPRDDGTACTDDGLTCTTDTCAAGVCEHDAAPDSCFINGTCFAAMEPDPTGTCRVCDPTADPNGFTTLMAGATCDDLDELTCTTATCDAAGACVAEPIAGACLINGTCYAPGDRDPANVCMACDPAMSTTAFTTAPAGTTCSTTACTEGTCSAGACTNEVPVADSCFINNTCYTAGAREPNNSCGECQPATSQTDWTARANGLTCGSAANCQCQAGTCRKNNGMICL